MIYVDHHTRKLSAVQSDGFRAMDEDAFLTWAAPLVRSFDQSSRPQSAEEAARRMLRRRIWERRNELQATPWPVEVSAGKVVQLTIDDTTLANLTGKLVLGLAGGDGSAVRWKQAGGAWISLTAAEVVAAAGGFGARKQSLFTREAELYSLLEEAVGLPQVLSLCSSVEAF